VHKSSVYLPTELKEGLASLSARSGRSEADLIRSAIERVVSGAAEPRTAPDAPAVDVLPRPSLAGVGVGPGDPGLMTLRGRAALAQADRVLVSTTDARSVGRAEMVVRAVAPAVRVQRVPYAIGAGDEARRASMVALAEVAVAATDAGERVAVAVLGDPAQWTVLPDVVDLVVQQRPDLVVVIEPGITAYQVAAATARARLGRPGADLVVSDRLDHVEQQLAASNAVVLYKASTDAGAVRAVAARARRDDGLVAELPGLPGARSVPLVETDDGPISYLATVVFPAPATVPVSL
jgi:precorrin-2/cobalt-factor-2 C20-methyltransferase